MRRKSTKQRVWHILLAAMHDYLDARQRTGYIVIEGQTIKCPDGYVPNWVFASIPLCGSTSGIRYLRQGKGFLPEQYGNQYNFQKKKIGHTWHYRVVLLPYISGAFITNAKMCAEFTIEKPIQWLKKYRKPKLKIRFAVATIMASARPG